MMKTIRGKLLVYFMVFVILFQVTAISIYVSSNQLTNVYHDSFERYLLLNAISQKSNDMYTFTKSFVADPEAVEVSDYYALKKELESKKEQLPGHFRNAETIEIKNYNNLIETFIHECELTIGFVILNDIEQYTDHLREADHASGYIQTSTLEMIDVELTAYQSFYNDLQVRNKDFFLFIVFLFMSTLILAVFFVIWFSKGITRPLNQLSRAAKEVAAGDLAGDPVDIQSKDELKLLGDTFNHMRSNIDELVQEIKDQSELDRLLKEMELKHLQNQINPHFLFNTLNTVSKMAYLEDAHATSSLIDSVAMLLRHSLGDINKSVTLSEEVDVVKDYFHIQKLRFAERVQVSYDIDDTCLEGPIPRLTLQPLVENAFIHGIEEREEGGKITLHVSQTSDCVFVEVRDDGVGMEQVTITQILSLAKQDDDHVGHSTGIGLKNVIRRLQLFYQVEDVVDIHSKPGTGTTIRVKIPKHFKGDQACES
ncbi:Sensor protein LytS [Lentibacillus sp. JNUCC-1]|uniref:sensor histidine kinase n=1 Tax=Lentibacillus sp. JNUCC-1 TaxID=2654513 RepID=UPI001329E7A0|nr:sensor histidine kinase [Lentibacillus sp. JNUCC-1]MUV37285.1 Sensor protein LytS [Lentibacillus sp. JNUCC-1]